MKIIAPSILSADFADLGNEIKSVEKSGADLIHLDVMDGNFVPNISMGQEVIKKIRKITDLKFDVHLMINNPDRYIEEFINIGADFISVHVEACIHLNRTIQMIKESAKKSKREIKAGVALNPSTALNSLDWIIKDIDYILIMSVNPGFGGQSFIDSSIDKIKALRKEINDKKLSALIQVDGGIKMANIGKISEAGADIFVAGSEIFGSNNYKETIYNLRKCAENGNK